MSRTATPVAPPLPAGCVDFNALHAAAVAGAQPHEALESALMIPDGERGAPAGETSAPETREPAAGDAVEVERLGGGWWHVTAPWLTAPLKIQGEDAALKKQGELQSLVPLTNAGEAGSNEENDRG
jgi:hypothetical protein